MKPLSHSGKSLLSGMSPKPLDPAKVDAIAKYLSDGGTITMVPTKKYRKHTSRTKSHNMGGKYSSYNVGGNNRLRAARKSA
jgi:hypothetical protein